MLVSLSVKNFAIIDNIDIDFNDKMTVLTGETGAGKSLIIDAINLLFGKRAKQDLIRFGEAKAIIEGVFSLVTDKMKEILVSLNIDISDEDYLIIRREIFENGKSICKVNSNVITLSNLNLLAEEIGDIHTQFDTLLLQDPKHYLEIIDDKEIKDLVYNYQIDLKKYNVALNNYNELIKKNENGIREEDFLRFQANELSKASLNINEEEDLKERAKFLNNYEKIRNVLSDVLENLDSKGTLDNLYNAKDAVNHLSKFDTSFSKIDERLSSIYFDLNDLKDEILNYKKIDSFDENELNTINERLSLYSSLKRKYKMTTKELIDYLDTINIEIDKISNYDFYINEVLKEKNKLFNIVKEKAIEISSKRKERAILIQNKLLLSLKDLMLTNTDILFSFNESKTFKKDGIDEVDFLVSFNKGEAKKPLSKVASGGELSRFMLALKEVLGENFEKQTLIFDEIDNGVSGSVSYAIAKKIKAISSYSQVLCVTHLPQVASIADNHIFISKITSNNRTTTITKLLTFNERVEEIASMISNGTVTDASRSLAIELLKK